MKTYNQVAKVLTDIAEAHLQIRQYGIGSPTEIPSNVNYPLMWAVYQPGDVNIDRKAYNQTFQIFFLDLLKEDNSNEAEVLSDMQLLAFDVLSQLQLPAYSDTFTVEPRARVEPVFENLTEDSVAGWVMTVTLRLDFLSNWCEVPSTLNPGAGGGCPGVNVYTGAGVLLATVNAGGTYTVVYPTLEKTNGDTIVTLAPGTEYPIATGIGLLTGEEIRTELNTANKRAATVQALTGAEVDSDLLLSQRNILKVLPRKRKNIDQFTLPYLNSFNNYAAFTDRNGRYYSDPTDVNSAKNADGTPCSSALMYPDNYIIWHSGRLGFLANGGGISLNNLNSFAASHSVTIGGVLMDDWETLTFWDWSEAAGESGTTTPGFFYYPFRQWCTFRGAPIVPENGAFYTNSQPNTTPDKTKNPVIF